MTFDTRPRAPCAHFQCNSLSIVQVKTRTGWANICITHYASANDQEAIDYCAKHGLDTTEKKIAHCRTLFRKPRDPRAWMENPKSELARLWRDELMRNQTSRVPGDIADAAEGGRGDY